MSSSPLPSTPSSESSMTHARALIRQIADEARDTPYSSKTIQEEVFAAQTMQKLTARYGTRGKSAKSIFLQGFRDEVMGRGKKHFLRILRQSDPDDMATMRKEHESVITNVTSKSPLSYDSPSSKSSSKIIMRPAAMVLYSKFCSRLEMLTKNQVFHLGLVPPPVETSWLFDEARDDSFKPQPNETALEDSAIEITEIHEMLDETEEKMVLRLKIYKRALGALILHCEALRPLLREIKRSYDSVLKLREWQLQEISWTTQNILTAEKEMQENIQSIGFEAFGVIKLMDNQCKQLMRHIDKQDSAIKVMTDILNTLESALGDEHESRRDSDDQNKMFIKDINTLRKKLGMPPRPEEGPEVAQVEEVAAEEADNTDLFVYTPDDPLILRKALDLARHDLYMTNQKLDGLEEEHKDEIPRRRFEQMKKDLVELKEDYIKLQNQAKEIQSQVQGTKDQIEKLTSERDTLKKQAAELRVKITPRPSWEKVGEFVDGGLPKWKQMYEGKSSIEISNKVIEELNAKKTAAAPEYLSALGDDPEVPRCLVHDTRVRDRRLARRDAEVIICDIWKSRLAQLESVKRMMETGESGMGVSPGLDDDDPFNTTQDVPLVTDFPEFVAIYFEEKFPNVGPRMEWTYNLVDACKRLNMNQKLSQFMGILFGRIDEGCYHLIRVELSRLQETLQGRSVELGRPLGYMSLGEFRQLLEQVYPHKSEDEIKSLIRVTSKQTKSHADWTVFKYDDLFAETDEGYEGEFIEEFSRQIDQDRMTYIHEIIRGLIVDLGITYDYEHKEEDAPGDTEVHILRFYKTLVAVDPDIKEEDIGATIAWVYGRESALPGLGPVGLPLVEYLKSRAHSPEQPLEQPDIGDDLEFEKVWKDLKGDMNAVAVNEGRKPGIRFQKIDPKQAKQVKLRVLIRRLKEGAFMHHGTKVKMPTLKKSGYGDEYGGEDYFFDEYGYHGEGEEEEDEEGNEGLLTI